MGWTGNKKLMAVIVCWVLTVGFVTLGVWFYAGYETSLKREKMGRLLKEHPELETDLAGWWKEEESEKADTEEKKIWREQADQMRKKYGYEEWSDSSIWYLWGFLIGCVTLAGLFLWWIFYRRWREQEKRQKRQFSFLLEQLRDFDRGRFTEGTFWKEEFREIRSAENDFTDSFLKEKWEQIIEELEELGRQLALQRERFTAEENNTKTLITDISHQLKTPLASLRMSHELTMSDDLTETERKEFLLQETAELERLGELLEELVKLSRLENHMITLSPELQSVNETVKDAISQIYGKAKGRHIEILVEMKEEVFAEHDRRWTAEAFVNILDNAVKYSEENTKVTLRMQKLTMGVLIEIEDEGMGIAPEELHKIFGRFYRGVRAGRKVQDGAGVGLYLARMIIEKQHGTIMAQPEVEKGSVFRVLLPG